ncbi:MAG: phosphoribosyl-ATP diphosphatase [Planctomycetaceae bacterium]|nr:phosphoribosyl-ATP diphosphatase [Planctomycetaceae bacterium]
MIIPSIDLMDGKAVQLVQGRTLVIDAGDPRPIAERFGMTGEIAVVDLDAALGRGSNAELIKELLRIAPCRVGGGIRDAEAAIRWLDAGATRVVLGTAATPEVLGRLPRERVIAALDAWEGEVVDHGWTRRTGAAITERIAALRHLVGEFLVTFVETEGTMRGLPAERAGPLLAAAGETRLTVAGGIRNAAEIAALDAMGVDAQVGMALYRGDITIAGSLAAMLRSDRPDGLWPTVVCDEQGTALGLAYSNAESLAAALDSRQGVYWSRERGLWRKGSSSGASQRLRSVRLDCDRDAIRFTVAQAAPGFCHRRTSTCWGAAEGLAALESRLDAAPQSPASYTRRLLGDRELLASKLREEAAELAVAATAHEVCHEAADLLYFTLVRMNAAGVRLADVAAELDRRARRMTRRPGDAKPLAQGALP